MSKQKVLIVKLADIEQNDFVRKNRDDDWVLQLAQLTENKVPFASRVTVAPKKEPGKYRIVDGRHRIGAYELCGISEIEVEVVDVDDDVDLIGKAFRANIGGSKPPTRADIDHAIEACLHEGVGERKIPEILGMPAGFLRNPIQLVKARIKKQVVNDAIDLMNEENLRPSEAAAKLGIDEDELRLSMKTNRKRGSQKVKDVTSKLSKDFQQFSRRNNSLVEKLFDQFDDGDISAASVTKILEHTQQLQKRHARKLDDYMMRFKAKSNGKNGDGHETKE